MARPVRDRTHGAFRALNRLHEQGVIKVWGLCVNTVEPCELALDMAEARPSGFLLAGGYTLLDHERALQRLTVTQSGESSG